MTRKRGSSFDEDISLVTRKRNRSSKKTEERVIKEKFMEERQKKISPLQAKSESQREALRHFNNKQLIVLSGSPGTGKSELMCWWASKQWLEGKVNNIVICRPHQHLGNDYGAVTGNDTLKLLPYCMSMLTKFKKYLGVGILKNNFKMETLDVLFSEVSGISIVPIEKIQGLSFSADTIVLADELQNCTPAQVKALVTRAEEGAQVICAGDGHQSALRGENGLSVIERVLEKYPHEECAIVRFSPKDNCRSGVAGHLANIFESEGGW